MDGYTDYCECGNCRAEAGHPEAESNRSTIIVPKLREAVVGLGAGTCTGRVESYDAHVIIHLIRLPLPVRFFRGRHCPGRYHRVVGLNKFTAVSCKSCDNSTTVSSSPSASLTTLSLALVTV